MSMKWLWCAVAAAAVAAVAFGSVQSTGALWRAQTTAPGGTVAAGTFSLTARSGADAKSSSYVFANLKSSTPLLQNQFVQKPLVLENSGTTPMTVQVSSIAVQLQSGAAVTVHLDGTVVASQAACTDTGTPTGTSAFSVDVTTGTPAALSGAATRLEPGATQILCVRSTLKTVPAVQSTYTHVFSFLAKQAPRA
ncbi:hypothetical protein [Rhodococcoides kyotonense]|uniref:SipW-cognate class signal peptide n=1 Tax=Rhodococcoides kyotonense TaxID=398843 RepID=A0A239J755_9NOCA|nr:hypothetical protein [Rhodococcus kyotonensis]SNT01660.1 hypothetical protein SAMN05421642_10883 [Rhodococcus kyotonensis]